MKRDPKFELTPHEQDQLAYELEKTTPEDRIVWADSMRMAFGLDQLKRSLDLHWRLHQPPTNLIRRGEDAKVDR